MYINREQDVHFIDIQRNYKFKITKKQNCISKNTIKKN